MLTTKIADFTNLRIIIIVKCCPKYSSHTFLNEFCTFQMPLQRIIILCLKFSFFSHSELSLKSNERWKKKKKRREREISEICVMEPFKKDQHVRKTKETKEKETRELHMWESWKSFLKTRDVKSFEILNCVPFSKEITSNALKIFSWL
jgi:hypothetical protein